MKSGVTRSIGRPLFDDAFDRVVNEEALFRPVLHVSLLVLVCDLKNERTKNVRNKARLTMQRSKEGTHTSSEIRHLNTCLTIGRLG